MKQNSVLSGLMFAVDFFSTLFKELKKRAVSEEMIFDALKSKSDLIQQMAEKIADLIFSGAAKNILRVLANLSFKDRIARGKYDWVNSDINEKNFPIDIPADYSVQYKLFHFNRNISSEDAIREMEREGCRPAKAVEDLAYGEQYPETQRQFPIVVLGSLWRPLDGFRFVLVLYSLDLGRELDLRWFEFDWLAVYRFLAVSK